MATIGAVTGKAAAEWKAHGWTVLATFAGFSLLSVMTASLSMFIEPVAHSFGWSRTLVTAGYTCATIITATLSPFFGIVLDRYGSRRVALPGIVITTLSISLFSLVSGSPTQWIALWVFYSLAALGIKTTVWTAAVSGLFSAGRGLALGLTLCGTAVAGIILPTLANILISGYGWQKAYLILGIGWGSVTFLLCWLFLSDLLSVRAKDVRSGEQSSAETPVLEGLSLAEAWRNRDLWIIILSTLIVMTLTMGLQIHQVPILEEAGVTRAHAALYAGFAGVAAICGKLVTGALMDICRPSRVGALTLAASALSFFLLMQSAHVALIILAMLINGYTQGTALQICSYLTASYAGMRNYGKIFGFVTSMIAIGSGMGPVIAAAAYDNFGNYGPFLILGMVGAIVAAILMLFLGRPPVVGDLPESASPSLRAAG